MPFQIQGDAEIIRITLSGQLTEAEISEVGRELIRLEATYPTTPNRLTDLTGVEKGELPFAAIHERAKRNRERVYTNKFKSAIVAPKTLDYGLTRIYQTLGEHPQVDLQIFKTRDEAEGWLAAKR